MRYLWSRNYRMIGSSLAVLVLTLFGLAAPASAGAPVPFTGSNAGVVTSMTRLPGGQHQLDISLAGSARHLGNVTGKGTILHDNQGNVTDTSCMVGANGKDSVCYAFSGRMERPRGSCVATARGPYTVTGGTGAFANATGGGTYTAHYYDDDCAGSQGTIFPAGTFAPEHAECLEFTHIDLEGWISW